MKVALTAALLAVAGFANATPAETAPLPAPPGVEIDQEGIPPLHIEDACPTCNNGARDSVDRATH